MRPVVLTGGPGAGKTTLLDELRRLGFATVSESAREVIAERLARGDPPRPDPESFAREILRRDLEKYARAARGPAPIFFDRGAVESLGMVHEVAPLAPVELSAILESHRFHDPVLVLPPWAEIYRTDAERDHTFAHSERVHASLVQWYGRCGYDVHEVPRLPVEARARHVLERLGLR